MNFLEAHRIASNFAGGPSLEFLFSISGGSEKLGVFFKAAGATRGRSVHVRTLPFNTLGQTLLGDPVSGDREVFVLFPWDFAAELDWRSGIPSSEPDLPALEDRARITSALIARRRSARLLYVPAPLPPVFSSSAKIANLDAWLGSLARSLGADFLPPDVFSLASYLSNGNPFASARLGEVADRVIDCALGSAVEPAKVLVTDLDNVLWSGVIGEDGVEGIRFTPEGVGFRHFLYQTLLLKLKREGALLAGVSRNDPELAMAPFRTGQMALREEDMVVVVASYGAKSSQIREIAKQLNLGLDSFVFVDDNPVELEEVSLALPEVRTVRFPVSDDVVPAFFEQLSKMFARQIVTAEDTDRTEMYRRRLEGLTPDSAKGADLGAFLRGLEMSMIIHDRSNGDRARAVQLINKTNQFNLNGRRVGDDEVGAILQAGGHLYGVTLTDRTGSHGEVLACLMDAQGSVRSLVMSCRVFQRRLEYAFLSWLGQGESGLSAFDFVATPRNEPIRLFLADPAFRSSGASEMVAIDLAEFRRIHADDLAMFRVIPPQHVGVGSAG